MNHDAFLQSVDGQEKFLLNTFEEFGSKGQALEVILPNIESAKIKEGNTIIEKYRDFLPFETIFKCSLGEGKTPLLLASSGLNDFLSHDHIYLKNETVNPTWSFKDRGSWAAVQLAKNFNEKVIATVSTGNMGNSTAAFAIKNGLKAVIIVPQQASLEKIKAACLHGAEIIRVKTNNYSDMKSSLAKWAAKNEFRLSSGNNAIRVEGYKITAFEIFEQMNHTVPEYIAVPTSACGHIRGIFKGFKELKEAGITDKLPKMVIVQAEGNAPLVNALKKGINKPDIVDKPQTIASAITTGNPLGGEEIINKAKQYDWLYTSVSEEKILEGLKIFAQEGHYVEPSTATLAYGIQQLIQEEKIKSSDKVVMILTGSGLKDSSHIPLDESRIENTDDNDLKKSLEKFTNI